MQFNTQESTPPPTQEKQEKGAGYFFAAIRVWSISSIWSVWSTSSIGSIEFIAFIGSTRSKTVQGKGPRAKSREQEIRGQTSEVSRAGRTPEALTRELIETALQTQEEARPKTAREALRAAGRVHPLSETLRRKIIPGVTLEEVRLALKQADGPSLSDIILEQRGSKS